MSAVSTRNKANSIESVRVPAGAFVAGACLFAVVKGLSALANAANNTASKKAKNLKSVAALRAESAPFETQQTVGGNLESLKTEAFKHLAAQPFLTVNPAQLEANVIKLDRAGNLTELKTAHREIVAKLESGHQQIFTTALLEAGKRAAVKIGFQKLESLPSPLASTVRFSATDAAGKTIVTEINAPLGGDARIETEVVGVSDGSCHAILDAFDKALEDEGVRSQPAERKFTGGVCELSAVRDFLKRKAQPASAGQKENNDFAPANDAKRRQRLNQKRNGQKQK